MREPKIHYRNIRLFNNGGITFPECAAHEPMLDVGKGAWETTPKKKEVTCKRCLKKLSSRGW